MPAQSCNVGLLVVWLAVFPATEQYPNPLKRQGPDRRVVTAAVGPLLIVIGPSPFRVPNAMGGPLVKGLPQEFRAGVAEMNPVPLTAPLPHRCNAAETSHLLRTVVAFAIGSEKGHQARR